ncbi:Re/Si-specific NAD(P)(+) transhydrogenase subunit alpha [Hahella sp. KA22]|uniref:Re/Si-specific NAD(P)(+) transhydrogenase subunit alpha n=1 Tax=Hahella sp. KA22 TaxID=1628392 RepID=UPI000FDDDF6B|nr:Re/Si-specific NAD(P)(+) transhydrogenase subunit alpha [Hahella sp. KA22]AZZ92714.1 Re/Si-specific NAD(P)(+) transhydrogenase subunit alpha [Hahella sp. KA22]QAY56088.1 Re/Si-specific NAD(P)(+) transhydrogenase subunit alpha [Hahella sp. KA22]
MQIGIPKESRPHEKRVAATPKSVEELIKLGFSVAVEADAGWLSSFGDGMYEEVGAKVVSREEAWGADIVLRVNEPNDEEVELLKSGATLIGFIWPSQHEELLQKLAQRNVTVLAMDSVPRISRAQSMDALSSMANIAGYRAVVEASHHFGRFFTGQITAAGKVQPAKILVIGAGVAGLAAIGTAGSLGAIVRAFDTRPEVKEQIQSMGAEFLEVDMEEESSSGDGYAKVMSKAFIEAEMKLFLEQAKDVDIIITTAMIPGKPAPKLITEEMVKAMRPGSVIVDLAAPNGGNCELTQPGEMAEIHEVKIVGYVDLPSRLPTQASLLYSNNLVNLMKLLCKNKDGAVDINFEDEVIRGVTVVKDGEITWPPPPIKVSAAPQQPKAAAAPPPPKSQPMSSSFKHGLQAAGALALIWLASAAPSEFLSHFTVFVLACIVGYHVVWSVTHALHTPLMSVTNAISGIIVVGALLQISSDSLLVTFLAAAATLIATINIVGGFVVTHRMLKMFRK